MTQLDRDIIFLDCYTKFYGFVSKYCHRFVNDDEVRADLVHDTFIKVYNNLHGFNGSRAKISTWIISIAKNTCLDHVSKRAYKARKRFVEIDKVALESNQPNPEQIAIRNQNGERLQIAIRDLSDIQKMEIGYYLQGYDGREIAEATNRPFPTVRQSLVRSRSILRGILQGRV